MDYRVDGIRWKRGCLVGLNLGAWTGHGKESDEDRNDGTDASHEVEADL